MRSKVLERLIAEAEDDGLPSCLLCRHFRLVKDTSGRHRYQLRCDINPLYRKSLRDLSERYADVCRTRARNCQDYDSLLEYTYEPVRCGDV